MDADNLTTFLGQLMAQQQAENRKQQEALIKSQQDFMVQFMEKFSSSNCGEQSSAIKHTDASGVQTDAIWNKMVEFHYDPDNGLIFDAWYSRYASLFTEEAVNLDDKAKVRNLLRKLEPVAHTQYLNYILPKQPNEYTFEETVNKLSAMFGKKLSTFNARYKCMKTKKEPGEDIVAYAAKVNRACEDFLISKIKPDEFKCLIFVCGLQSNQDSDIRTKLLAKIDGNDSVNIQDLVLDCQRLTSLKTDTQMVEQQRTDTVHKLHTNKFASSKSKQDKTPSTPCWYCGEMHYSSKCTYRKHFCKQCKYIGHKEGYCTVSKKFTKRKTQDKHETKVNQVNQNKGNRKFVTVQIRDMNIKLQIDTGSDITIISEQQWNQLGRPDLEDSCTIAKDASGDTLPLLGKFSAKIKLGNTIQNGECHVTSVPNLNLFGINLITQFKLWDTPINTICSAVTAEPQAISSMQEQYSDIFEEKLGCCTKTQIELKLRPDSTPVFRPKRPIAYTAISMVDNELQRLLQLGIISETDNSDWAAPIVVTKKSNGDVRICGDYSTGLNEALEAHKYPLPTPEDIFSKLAGNKIFSVIDLSDAFLQVEVSEQSRKLLTINTHRGLYVYNRLPFGIKTSPTMFQLVMDKMIAGLEGVAAYIDDIIVAGKDVEQHKNYLHKLFSRIREYGFKIKLSKCKFFMNAITYLGHVINSEGIRPDVDRKQAIINMPPPHDIQTLRSYLGSINYYGKFIKQMHTLRQPLDNLLKANTKWCWTKECQKSFDKFKELLQSDLLLTHYNPKLDIIVAADASNSGIGACILHKFPDKSVKAVAHAARNLTQAEKNYSQIEKEGLALIFAVTKFHKMLYGRKFTLQTDHKPLLTIFGSKKGIPAYTANRLQRWALTLKAYDFNIEYIKTENFGHADILSRLIDSHTGEYEDSVIASIKLETEIIQTVTEGISNLPINEEMVKQAQQKDELLQTVISYVKHQWPPSAKSLSSKQIQFYNRRGALYVSKGILMLENRVVIPSCFYSRILQQLHKGHPGQNRMKQIARSYVYWPNIDQDIVNFVRQCESCSLASKTPIKVPLAPWPIPAHPWTRLHMDYAGPIRDTYYLVIVDAYSKWPEIIPTKTTTSLFTVKAMTEIFARFGLPESIVSDNGTQFTSDTFKKFCSEHGIYHITTATYHPQSNGQAERFVDTLKRCLKKWPEGGQLPLEEHLHTFLQMYRSTANPNTPEGKSPAETLMGRKMRLTLDLLKPKSQSTARQDGMSQGFNKKHGSKERSYQAGQLVYVKQHRPNDFVWVPATVVERIGDVMYNVITDCDQLRKVHANQLKLRYTAGSDKIESAKIPLDILLEDFNVDTGNMDQPEISPTTQPDPLEQQVQSTRPKRVRKLPTRLKDFCRF